MQLRSPTVAPAETGSVNLSAGIDSPVSAASSDAQILHVDQAQVGGNSVPRFEDHDVAGNQFVSGNQPGFSAAYCASLGREHVADRIERFLRPALLDEAEQGVENDHRHNDRGVEPQPQHQLCKSCGQQHVNQNVVELQQEPDERSPFGRLR